jgi:hypothetical protein
MRSRSLLIGCVLAVLQGCATAPGGASAPQLFDASANARFHFYLSCVSKTVNCEIVERSFDDWADMHHVVMHTVPRDDPAFATGKPSSAKDQDRPYRLAVRYSPEMAPTQNALGGGTGLPMVSYEATVQVFDAASGSLLKTMNFHDQKVADSDHGAANPYLRAQVEALLGHLDSSHAKGASAN